MCESLLIIRGKLCQFSYQQLFRRRLSGILAIDRAEAYLFSMNKSESLIDQLYTDSGPFDKERVVRTLKSVLAIQRGEHFVHFKREVPLKNEDKILAYALVKKLLSAERIEENSGFSGKEVHLKTGIPQGTVDPTIQKLRKDGALVGKGSNYEIPTHQIEAVLERLESYTEKK